MHNKAVLERAPLHPAVAHHERLAPQWEGKYRKTSYLSRERLILSHLEGLDLKSRRWLDAGCGTGRLSRLLAGRGCLVQGVDASPAMIDVARREATSEPNAGHLQFDGIRTIEDLPSEDGSFDGILCSSVLEYLERPERCLAEFARVLKADGTLLVSVPNQRSVLRKLLRLAYRVTATTGRRPWPAFLQHSKNEYTPRAFATLLARCGLQLVRVTPFGGPLPPWMQQFRVVGPLLLALAVKRDC